MTTVLIQKVNAGVSFRVVLKSGKPSKRKLSERDRSALWAALGWYGDEVVKLAEAHGFSLRNPRDNMPSVSSESLFVPLEPWGFASGTFQEPRMGDTGSSPTDSRARALLCYQAPLEAKQERDYTTFSRVVNVERSETQIDNEYGPSYKVPVYKVVT